MLSAAVALVSATEVVVLARRADPSAIGECKSGFGLFFDGLGLGRNRVSDGDLANLEGLEGGLRRFFMFLSCGIEVGDFLEGRLAIFEQGNEVFA